MKLNIISTPLLPISARLFTTDASGQRTGRRHSKAAPLRHLAKERPHIALPIIKKTKIPRRRLRS